MTKLFAVGVLCSFGLVLCIAIRINDWCLKREIQDLDEKIKELTP